MQTTFQIRGELITLDALLKAAGIAGSGAQAKEMVAEGAVLVDGETENRKTRKLRGGELVEIPEEGVSIQLVADPAYKTE